MVTKTIITVDTIRKQVYRQKGKKKNWNRDWYDYTLAKQLNAMLYLDKRSPLNKEEPIDFGPINENIIYPRDIAIIFGNNSPKFAQYIIDLIREKLYLKKSEYIVVEELSDAFDFDEETLRIFIRER